MNFLMALFLALATPQVMFAPDTVLMQSLIELIDNEQESIRIACDYLSHPKVAKALKNAKQRGVAVELVVDRIANKPKLLVHELAKEGIPISIYKGGHMHHKFCIFGDKSVWTSSMALTKKRTEANRENATIITDCEVVKQYCSEFDTLKKMHSRPLPHMK